MLRWMNQENNVIQAIFKDYKVFFMCAKSKWGGPASTTEKWRFGVQGVCHMVFEYENVKKWD